jgi:hypothetical protein
MNETIIAAIAGCLGGLTRSFIGIFKAKARKDKIRLGYITRTMRLSAISGTFIGAIFGLNPILSFTVGYVGSDAIEGIHSSFKRTKFAKKYFNIN